MCIKGRFNNITPDVPGRIIHSVGYNHPFQYGAHLIDPIRQIVDSPWEYVEPLPELGQAVTIKFENGSWATAKFDGPDSEHAFGYLDIADRTSSIHIDEMLPNGVEEKRDEIYSRFLSEFLRTVRSKYTPPTDLIDGAELLIAAVDSLRSEKRVSKTDDDLQDTYISGTQFVADYEPYWLSGELAERY
jgi:hypothetical protein